jgi:hypothetical protein
MGLFLYHLYPVVELSDSKKQAAKEFDKSSIIANKDFFNNRVYSNPFLCYENMQNCPVVG